MVTAIIAIISLSVLIFVHELGHFIMAKRAKMKVEEFGFGFPPRAWGYKPKNSETTYSINWIPFGGFVKILGEDGENKDTRSFSSGSFWSRTSVVVAGVMMNVILAVVLYGIINLRGVRMPIENVPANLSVEQRQVTIFEIMPGTPATDAGFQQLDAIEGMSAAQSGAGYSKPNAVGDVQEFIAGVVQSSDGTGPISFRINRGGTIVYITATPRLNPPAGQGALGITLGETGIVHFPWYIAIWEGIKYTWQTTKTIVVGFGILFKNLFTTGKPGMELSGPVRIAEILGQAARLGFNYLLSFVAFISLNLAVINILPFPALDGGRLLFIIIEKIKGSPLPKRIEATVNSVGFILLIMLMVYATTKDVIRFF